MSKFNLLLANYLNQIEHELRELPAQARADELREIEAHLQTMIEARGDVAGVLAQFGQARKVGRELRRAWERKQPEKWWRAVLAPIAGVISFATSVLVYNKSLDYLGDIVNQDWSNPMYFCFGLIVLVMFFFAGFAAGIISPKRGLLLTLAYSVYCATILFTLPAALDRADVPGESVISVIFLFLLFGLLAPIAALAGTYFGARRSRKIATIAGVGGNKFLAHITASRKFLARIAGDSKLNVQL